MTIQIFAVRVTIPVPPFALQRTFRFPTEYQREIFITAAQKAGYSIVRIWSENIIVNTVDGAMEECRIEAESLETS